MHSGHWTVDPIGFPEELLTNTQAVLIEGPIPFCRPRDSHKGDNGRVLVVAGSSQYRGAATLAALGALRAGAGLVTVAATEPVITAVAAQVPEATFISLPEVEGAIGGAPAAERIQVQASRFTSAVFGPGLTTALSVKTFLEHLWRTWTVPSVIDADALNLVSLGLALPSCPKVLTPHPGEAGRLLGCDPRTIQSDRFSAARNLQSRFGCAVLLKGAYTVVACQELPLTVNPTGNSGMATGGMGDVLSGVTAALMSDPLGDPESIAVTAAYWHGLAGDLAAKEIGEIGFSASDLAQFLPRARSILTT
jgi:NAD(P)H-hydrate epimerase